MPNSLTSSLLHKIAVDIAHLDRTETSVLQSRLDLGAVTRSDDHQLVRVQVLFSNARDVFSRNSAILFRQLRVVVQRTIVEEDRLHRSGCCEGSFELSGQ